MGVCFFCGKPATSEHGDICRQHERKLMAPHAEILRTRPHQNFTVKGHDSKLQRETIYWGGTEYEIVDHVIETTGYADKKMRLNQPHMHNAKRQHA